MFIAMAPSKPIKLRRSGMVSRQIGRDETVREPASCRSYGAWFNLVAAPSYKHGAPNGAFGFPREFGFLLRGEPEP